MAQTDSPVGRAVRHPMLRRLPLLLIAVIGVWLWQQGPSDRQIIWRLPFDRVNVEELEIQLRDEEGDLIERIIRYAPVPGEITQEVSVGPGTYQGQLFIKRRGKPTELLTVPVQVEGDVAMPHVPMPKGASDRSP